MPLKEKDLTQTKKNYKPLNLISDKRTDITCSALARVHWIKVKLPAKNENHKRYEWCEPKKGADIVAYRSVVRTQYGSPKVN